jgi:adenylate cyclase class 2
MIEKEIKILNIDTDNIEKLLLSKGCILCKDEVQENIIYKKDNISIKLRYTLSMFLENKIYELIRKEDVRGKENNKYKIKNELSKIINKKEYEYLQKIFEFMDFNKVLSGVKMRKSYELNGYLYEIDSWNSEVFPIPYLEIEALDPKLSINKGLQQIWSKKEIKNLILSNDSILDLHEFYFKATNNFKGILKEIKE